MKDPKSDEEWQEAVDGASFLLTVESARLYGLVDTDIKVNADRCSEILKRGAARGVNPAPFEVLFERYMNT